MKSLILDLHKKISDGSLTPEQLVKQSKEKAVQYSFTNSIITPLFDQCKDLKFNKNNLLSCIPYSLKDNISTKGIRTTGGSAFLKDYIAPYSATVYEILKAQGATLISKDALDEFGLGGTGNHCFTGKVIHPIDADEETGGSSSGSSVNVATGISVFAIGTDTGDSIRRPPSRLGVIGFKPTYGAISRYGVMPYSPCHDTIGIITKYVADTVIVAQQLIKHDDKDLTSTNKITNVKLDNLKVQQKIKFAIIKEFIDLLDKKQRDEFDKLTNKLKQDGHEIIEFSFDKNLFDHNFINLTYRIITYTYAYSCLSNLQGMTFGPKIKDETDYYKSVVKARTEGFGNELKRRLTIGEFYMTHEKWPEILNAAKKFRHAYKVEIEKILEEADCIFMPTLPICGTNFDNANKYEPWLVLANFIGAPDITIPYSVDDKKIPWGVSILGKPYDDMKVLNIAYTVESKIGGNNE